MDRSEAFKTLGLPSTATRLEIKKAHRDLAKVWHPDRFGTDPRLRSKAEETLKGVNEAYQLLRGGAAPPPNSVAERPQPFRISRPLLMSAGLAFLWIAWSLSCPRVTAPPNATETALSERADSAGPLFDGGKPAIENPVAKAQEQIVDSSPMKPLTLDWEPPPYSANRTLTAPSTRANARPREARELSELGESERQSIEAVCSGAKYLEGSAAYNRCLRAQLAQLASAPSRPDLSGLSGAEEQSIEAVCSTAKYLEGPAAYNRCLRIQLAQLHSISLRPDLSGLSRTEQQTIEAACSKPKYLEGPAAYTRCVIAQLRSMKRRD